MACFSLVVHWPLIDKLSSRLLSEFVVLLLQILQILIAVFQECSCLLLQLHFSRSTIMLIWKLLLFLVSSFNSSSDEEQHRLNQASLLQAADDGSILKNSTRPKKCPGCKKLLSFHKFGPASCLCEGQSSS